MGFCVLRVALFGLSLIDYSRQACSSRATPWRFHTDGRIVTSSTRRATPLVLSHEKIGDNQEQEMNQGLFIRSGTPGSMICRVAGHTSQPWHGRKHRHGSGNHGLVLEGSFMPPHLSCFPDHTISS